MKNKLDVVVIGLGAMGAAATYQLARRGADVVGIDQFAPPHDQGSTHGETRITRLAIGEGLQFVPLAQRSHELWREIERESGNTIFNQCGGLIFARTGRESHLHGRKDFLGATIDAAKQHRIPHELLNTVSLSERFPNFELIGDERGYYESQAGYLDPETAVAAQLKLAKQHGAKLISGSEASLRGDVNETVVECGGVEYRPKKTVVAAGGWVPQLIPELASGLKVSRQVLYWFELDGSCSYSPDVSPVFIWNWGDGENDVFYGFPQVGDEPMIKIATEQVVTTTTPQSISRQVTGEEISSMFQRHVSGKLRGVTSNCRRAATCLYTTTADSNFVIDWLPERRDTLVISACSGHGFKHSAAIGEAVAEMVATGVKPELLRPFSLNPQFPTPNTVNKT